VTRAERTGGAAAIAAVVVIAVSSPAMAQFKDQLVQAPRLAPAERGSVAGSLSGVNFTATELARGAFRLPLALDLPRDRGPLQAGIAPAYSPDNGLSEWGMGWGVDLAIRRHRLVGEINYVDDELVSPWGRLRPGDDGKLYPSGLATAVRITADGSDYVALTTDGTQYRFRAASGVTTDRGVYSWQLTDVVNLAGDRTTLEWAKNASGRPFLTRVTWGGRTAEAQYELVASYELLATSFTDHTTGAVLDRRITGLRLAVRDPASGAFVERWHDVLGYRAAPFGPAFYLETAQRVFASGQQQPARVYRYELDETRLSSAALERYAGLDGVLSSLGGSSLLPDRAALQDIEADGVPDFEHAAQQTQIQHADAGWAQAALPVATGTDFRCRPSANSGNTPRVLVRLTTELGAPHVLFIRRLSTQPVTSTVLVCDRLGRSLAELTAEDDWTPGPLTRLVDVDRDRRPDIVRVSRAGVDVLRNESDAQGFRFRKLPRFTWPLGFTPSVAWLHDLDGDGNVDIVIRTSTGLWTLFGLGNYRWTTTPQLFRFITQSGSALGSVDSSQVTFVDANKDGLADVLLSQGTNVALYSNRGSEFREVPVPAFRSVGTGFGLPIATDLTGRGNAEVAFPVAGTIQVVSLALPSTGLLASADDGMGTVLRFQYARSVARAGIEQRLTVLDQLTVESSGYDAVTYRYSYGSAVVHTAGKQLVGFDSVVKRSPMLGERIDFRNDDDVAGVTSRSEDTDDRSPGIVRFAHHVYDDVLFQGVRWLRPAQVETGYRSADGTTTLSSTTQYALYERGFCPTVVVNTTPSGQLMTSSTLTSVAALPGDFHCLAEGQLVQGSHGDARLDFSYLASLARNELGQVTRVTQMDLAGRSLVLQDTAYTTDHRVASVGAPGRGTTQVAYDASGRLSTITDPVGVVTQASAIDPITDDLRVLQTQRPGAPATAFFDYDGRERLQASWDDVTGSSRNQPLAAYSYQDATGTAPARIDTQTLADAITGTSRSTVDLLAADGAPIVGGAWLGDHYALGAASVHTRNTLTERHSFIGVLTRQAVSAMTSSDVRALGTPLVEAVHAGFGHVTQTTTTQQDGVVGTVTSELLLSGGELITRSHEPGGITAESALDAAGKLVRKTDENGVVHRYAYDALGRLVRVDTPDGAQTVRFDSFGRPAQVTRDAVGAITYAYDATTGLVTQKQRLDAAGAVTDTSQFHYDTVGRATQIARSGGNANAGSTAASDLTFDYDGHLDAATAAGQLGRLSRVRGDGWARSTLFDALGRASSQHVSLTGWRDVATDTTYRAGGSIASHTITITDPAGREVFASTRDTTLDSLGRVATVQIDGNVLYALSYDAEGRLARADFTSGEAIAFDYDPTTHARRGHQVDSLAASGGVRWDRDPRGLIADEVFTHGALITRRTYDYDGRGALLRSTAGNDIATYTYTASGLPDTISDTVGTRSVRHTAGSQRIGDTVYTWDAAGRVAGKGDWTFDYGAHGQIAHAHRAGRDIEFVYDDADQRLVKRVDGVPVRADIGGAVLTEGHFVELVTVGGVVAGVLDNGKFTALLTDPRGTPFAGPDGTAGLATPYGVRASHLGYADVIDYARLGWDPDLDIVRMGVRDYDAKLGQFWTPDPLYFEDLEKCADSPLQCTLYGYAGGNPISFVDPTGLGIGEVFGSIRDAAVTAASFTVEKVVPRAIGAAKAVGGAGLVSFGTAACLGTAGGGCVLGAAAIAYGVDLTAAGVRQVGTGKHTNTQANRIIAKLTNQQFADNAELAVAVGSLVGSIANAALRSPLVARALGADVQATGGMVHHGPMNPGPLPDRVANTFRSSSYTANTLDEATTLYRVYGGTASPLGAYWTRTAPAGPFQSQIDLALSPEWGNTATQVTRITVPAGTTIYEGAAAAQGGIVGGGSQVYIPKVDPSWVQK